MNKIAINKIQAKVRELITGGYLEDALNESEQLSFRHKDRLALTNLEAQLNQAKADLHAEKLNNDDYSIRINRITNALLELIDKALVEENESNTDKVIAFFKRFWVFIGGLGVVIALLSDSKSVLEGCKGSTKNDLTIAVDSLDCGFPKKFKDDSLYILITAFENDAQRFSSDCFGQSLLRRIDAKRMPIKICYRPDLAPKQREDVKRLQNKYNADLVLWGNLKNLSQNCGEGDICFKSLPSDTIIKICGGKIETEKSDLKYEKQISSEDIEQGALRIGDIAFDSWIIAVFNAKIGSKKPDFFVIDENLQRQKQAELWNEKGDLYLELANLEKSKFCYETSIKLFEFNEAYYKRGLIKYLSKDFNAAVKDCDMALNRNFINESVYELRSMSNRGLLDYVTALNDINKAIHINPFNSLFYTLRGVIKTRIKNYKSAIIDYDIAVELDPNPTDYYNRGACKYELKDYKGAISDYNIAIELDSAKAGAYHNRGAAKYIIKDYKGAILDYDKAIEINPHSASAFTNRGHVKSELKDFKGAINDYDKAIEIDPKDVNTYKSRGTTKFESKNYKAAIEDYNKVIEFEQTDAKIYNNRGYAKSELKDFEGAILDYNKAVEIDPKNMKALVNRGYAKSELKDFGGATTDYGKVIEVDPKNIKAITNRGYTKFILKDYKGSITDYDKAIELDPYDANTYNNRGNVKSEFKDFKGSIIDYDKAIELNQKDTKFYNNRGHAKSELKDYKSAIIDYHKAIELDPNYAIAFNNRGKAYKQLGEKEKAEKDFEKARDLSGQFKDEKWYYKWGKFLVGLLILVFFVKRWLSNLQ